MSGRPLGNWTVNQSPVGEPKPAGTEKSTDPIGVPLMPPERTVAVIGVEEALVDRMCTAKPTMDDWVGMNV